MGCTKHFLGFHWEHHNWRPHVTFAEYAPTRDTNMWGRPVDSEFVRCHKEFVCQECGAVRDFGNCICDKAEGEQCPPRVAWLEEQRRIQP